MNVSTKPFCRVSDFPKWEFGGAVHGPDPPPSIHTSTNCLFWGPERFVGHLGHSLGIRQKKAPGWIRLILCVPSLLRFKNAIVFVYFYYYSTIYLH